MDVLTLKRPSLAVYGMVCGLGVAAGFGSGTGLMTGGILGGLAIALVSVEPGRASRAASLGVAGGLGMLLGETLFGGGLLEGLAVPPDLTQGPVRLAVRGAVCGGLGGGALGMALSRARYRWRDVLWLALAVVLWLLFGGFRTGIPRVPGAATGVLAMALALFLLWLYTVKQDGAAVMVAGCGMVGFSLGLALGSVAGAWAVRAGWADDPWPIAKLMWGMCGGAAWGLAARILDEDGCGPHPVAWQWPTYAGLLLMAWWVPVRHGWGIVSASTAPHGPLPAGAPYVFLGVAAVVLCAAAVAVSRNRGWFSVRTVAALVFLWVLWTAIGCRALFVCRTAGTAGVRGPLVLLLVLAGGVLMAYAAACSRISRMKQSS